MMKTILIIVLTLVVLFIVKLVIARRKFTKQWKQDEHDALLISRKVYEPLSLSERYAFIFIFDVFMKNIRTNVRSLAIAHHQMEFESQALGVTAKDADSCYSKRCRFIFRGRGYGSWYYTLNEYIERTEE